MNDKEARVSLTRGNLDDAVQRLMAENKPNLSDPSDEYAMGYHDALLDVLLAFGIPTDEKHFD